MALKERHFLFSCGDIPEVKCLNCGWKPTKQQQRGLGPQEVFDLSCGHECDGVESYTDFRARDAREVEEWRQKHAAEPDAGPETEPARRGRPIETVHLPEPKEGQ